MLDFRVESFLAVCRHMSYTKAAQELNLTQPAVSQHIRFLEEQYHTRFFTCSGKKVHLTEAGKVFQNAALTMKHDTIHLHSLLGGLEGKGRQMVFGATLTIAEYVLQDALLRYLKERPEDSLRMVVGNTHELLAQLDEGEIDFALVEGYFERGAYDYLVYSTQPYIGVCAAGRKNGVKCGSGQTCCMEELLSEKLIVREPGSGTREILEKYLSGKNLSVRDFASCSEIGNINVIKRLVEQDCGITFLYEAAVQKELSEGTLCRLQISDFEIQHDFTFVWRKDSIFKEEYYRYFKRLLREP